RQAVPLSPPEAWMLFDLVSSFPAARRSAVLGRFAQVRERLEHEGFGERSLPATASMDQVQALGLDYFRLGLPCPFLEEESRSIPPLVLNTSPRFPKPSVHHRRRLECLYHFILAKFGTWVSG